MRDQQIRDRLPLISIGMPVRNEAAYIEAALAALRAQLGVEMEILISDNASTDSTEAICRRIAESDPRIRYHRFDSNVGASANFRFVLEEARGEYFMWASGHDLWDADYLEKCGTALRNDRHAMIAFGTPTWIGPEGAPLDKCWGWSDTRGLSVIARYFTVFWGNMNPIIGLIRTQELQGLRIDDLVGVDLALLLALVMKGDFVHVPATGWCRRDVRSETSYAQKLARYRGQDYALGRSWLWRHFPLVRLPCRLLGDVFAAELSVGQKLQLVFVLLASLPVKYWVDKTRKSVTGARSAAMTASGTGPPGT